MAQYFTVARPYANAVFQEAHSNPETLQAWAHALKVLAVIIQETPVLQLALNPKVSKQQLTKLLVEVIQQVAQQAVALLGDKVATFITLLVENRRLNIVPDLMILYNRLVLKQQNIMHAQVTSAFELSQTELGELKAVLSKRFKVDVQIEFAIDKSLIGGAVIRTDDFVLDGSIKDKLNRLYYSLNNLSSG